MDYEIATHLGESEKGPRFASHESRIIDANIDMLPKKDRSGQRAQHPKGHATALAEFTVLPIPDEHSDLRVGLFKEPSQAPLEAYVRFSNSRYYIDNPESGDAHGMAVKVVGVPGEKFQPDPKIPDSFDFILMNSETFFDGDLAQYANFNDLGGELIDARRNGGQRFWGAINGLALFAWLELFDRDLKHAIADISSRKPDSPVTQTYWSTTPYLLGPNLAVKYIMEPAANNTQGVGPRTHNYLQQRLRGALEDKAQVFTLKVHVMDPTKGDPIEDPTVAWSSTRIVPVAQLTLLPINKDDDVKWAELRHARETFGYNIWNVTADHRPLGAINRVRRKVYSTLRDIRNNPNSEVYQ